MSESNREQLATRRIYSLWLEGRSFAPPIVRLNFERWERLNPDCELIVLDRAESHKMIGKFPVPLDALPPAALSDIVRAKLLLTHGGTWVDASVFPVEAVKDWLPKLLSLTGFFAFERPGPDRLLSSWMVAAYANHPILQGWWNEILTYWQVERTVLPMDSVTVPEDPTELLSNGSGDAPYFWFHYLFARLVSHDEQAARLWTASAKLPAESAHAIQSLYRERPEAPYRAIVEAASQAPVQKLDWRQKYPIDILERLGKNQTPLARLKRSYIDFRRRPERKTR